MPERHQQRGEIFYQKGLWGDQGHQVLPTSSHRKKKVPPGIGVYQGQIVQQASIWTADQMQPEIEQGSLFSTPPGTADPPPPAVVIHTTTPATSFEPQTPLTVLPVDPEVDSHIPPDLRPLVTHVARYLMPPEQQHMGVIELIQTRFFIVSFDHAQRRRHIAGIILESETGEERQPLLYSGVPETLDRALEEVRKVAIVQGYLPAPAREQTSMTAPDMSVANALPAPKTLEAEEAQQVFLAAHMAATTSDEKETEQETTEAPALAFPVRPLVTLVRQYNLTNKQKEELVIPTPLCIVAVKPDRRDKEVFYRAGLIIERNPETGKQRDIDWFHKRTADLEEAYRVIERAVQERGLSEDALQPIQVPEKKEPEPTPAPTEQDIERNPLLEVLKPDEIYEDPYQLTEEEARDAGAPILRKDVLSHKFWLDFPYDVREHPEEWEALKANGWRWGYKREQYHNSIVFARVPKGMYYGQGGFVYYAEERGERLDERSEKTMSEALSHKDTSDRMASIIPFGQPLQHPTHHSYKRDLNYRKKIWKHMDTFVELYDQAESLESRAESSRRHQRRKRSTEGKRTRLKTLEEHLRVTRQHYQAELKREGGNPDEYRRRMTLLAYEMVPLKRALKDVKTPFEQLEKPLEKDDCIVIHGQQSYVVRVNPKTITVWRWVSGQKWEFKYPKEDFQRWLLAGEKVRELEAQASKEQSEL